MRASKATLLLTPVLLPSFLNAARFQATFVPTLQHPRRLHFALAKDDVSGAGSYSLSSRVRRSEARASAGTIQAPAEPEAHELRLLTWVEVESRIKRDVAEVNSLNSSVQGRGV